MGMSILRLLHDLGLLDLFLLVGLAMSDNSFSSLLPLAQYILADNFTIFAALKDTFG
jgi:hypothetical protein